MKAKVSELDLKLFRAIFNFRRDTFLPVFFRVISFLGDGYVYVLYPLFLYFKYNELFKPAAWTILIAFAVELPGYFILKHSIRRIRPFNAHSDVENLVYPIDEFSFPSGHTSVAFLMATIIASFSPFLAVPVYVFALLVGISRIYVGVHYPSDIIGGIFYGVGMGHLAIYLTKILVY